VRKGATVLRRQVRSQTLAEGRCRAGQEFGREEEFWSSFLCSRPLGALLLLVSNLRTNTETHAAQSCAAPALSQRGLPGSHPPSHDGGYGKELARNGISRGSRDVPKWSLGTRGKGFHRLTAVATGW